MNANELRYSIQDAQDALNNAALMQNYRAVSKYALQIADYQEQLFLVENRGKGFGLKVA